MNENVVRSVAARIYLVLAENMPENASDEWFLQPDISGVNVEDVRLFVNEAIFLRNLITSMGDGREPVDYQTEFYNSAKRCFGEEKSSIRKFFSYLYAVLFGKDSGPRWGEFVAIVGVEHFNEMMVEQLGV